MNTNQDDTMNTRAIIEQYVNGWKEGSVEKILAVLIPDCYVRESYGPTYRGHANIRKWIENWNTAGNHVTLWNITSFYELAGTAVFEWAFACWADNRDHHFLGVSIAELQDGKIASLREYRMTAAPKY